MSEAKRDESDLSALLCCPFCGNDAIRYRSPWAGGLCMTGCKNNLCYVSINKGAVDSEYDGFRDQKEADLVWNTRAT